MLGRHQSLPGTQTVLLSDPISIVDTPEWVIRSPGGFSGFGELPALRGIVLSSGIIITNTGGQLTLESSGIRTIVEYNTPIRLFHIAPASAPEIGDTVLVRVVDGIATGVLRSKTDLHEP